MEAPADFAPAMVSIIVPVRDNQAGADRLVRSIARGPRPLEVILVDNGSSPPLRSFTVDGLNVQILRCSSPGPAAARNAGAAVARGRWLLFVDSDCELRQSTLSGFATAMNGAVGYAGAVRAKGVGRLDSYYDSQKTLVPPPKGDRPAYLVTACALVWREAFEAVGGFNQTFRLAGGEDIELALRLGQLGELSYAPDAIVKHDFEGGLPAFVRRFVRYGTGNRVIEQLHGGDMRPRFFVPAARTPAHLGAALLQVVAMRYGYARTRPHRLTGSDLA